MHRLIILFVFTGLAMQAAAAEITPQPHAPGIESANYNWADRDDALRLALSIKGDPKQGEAAYLYCQGCHKAKAVGRPDAGYPQLAGQHASVLVKQMMDVRSGVRESRRMHPFIEQSVVNVTDIPHIAAYLNSLPIPTTNRKGDGSNLARGKSLYVKDCQSCHGAYGEGDAGLLYPRVTGQHYPYLYRETLNIRDLQRRNANEEMVRSLKGYSDEDVEAVSDYMSRLVDPHKSATR